MSLRSLGVEDTKFVATPIAVAALGFLLSTAIPLWLLKKRRSGLAIAVALVAAFLALVSMTVSGAAQGG